MPEFCKILTESEILSGTLCWSDEQDAEVRKVLPPNLMVDLLWKGKKIPHLTVEWEKRELYIGDPLMKAAPGTELSLSTHPEKAGAVVATLRQPEAPVIIRKRLSMSEFKARALKWFAREDELYSRLLPAGDSFAIEIHGKVIPNRRPDFEKRTLLVGEALRAFSPGDTLIIHRTQQDGRSILVIDREDQAAETAADAMTSLRALVTRLISRPLNEFNEGEVKGLIALLDENKNLWERLSVLREENEKLKEQIATLENVFAQFARNTFFTNKRDFLDWVIGHLAVFEKGIRLLHRDYAITWDDGSKRRIDLLCQDRKGVLVAIEVVFNPCPEDLEGCLRLMSWLKENIRALGHELTEGRLQANSIRGWVITNLEKPEMVETCLENNIRLCVVNSGFVIDTLE